MDTSANSNRPVVAFVANSFIIFVEPTVRLEQLTLPLHEKLPDPLNVATLVVPP